MFLVFNFEVLLHGASGEMGTEVLGYLPVVEAERIPLGSSSVSQRLIQD